MLIVWITDYHGLHGFRG